jgi:hypothetical protein
MDTEGASSIFVVRMWAEASADAEPSWRGQIDDLLRKRRVYFTNLGTMCEFMLEQRRLAIEKEEMD